MDSLLRSNKDIFRLTLMCLVYYFIMASGGSVIALQYDKGVLIAADTLLSYGSMAMFPNVSRIKQVTPNCCVGFTGDYADFQNTINEIEEHISENDLNNDAHTLTPDAIFSYTHRNIYHRRSEFKPVLCELIFIGYTQTTAGNKITCGAIDTIGTKWTDTCVALGYGAYICIPIMRAAMAKCLTDGHNPLTSSLTRNQALQVIEQCLKELFYREARSINRFLIHEITESGVNILPPVTYETTWNSKGFNFQTTAIIQ